MTPVSKEQTTVKTRPHSQELQMLMNSDARVAYI
jgi:hypothetical protein